MKRRAGHTLDGTDRVQFLKREKLGSRLRKFVLIVGVCWAVAAWLLWPVTPHRGYVTALGSAIWLAPSYILLSVYRGAAIPMRVFVGCATGFLLLIGMRVIPGSYDPVLLYLVCPPVLALATALARHYLKAHDTGRPSAEHEPDWIVEDSGE